VQRQHRSGPGRGRRPTDRPAARPGRS
jgi:hypothetical protein